MKGAREIPLECLYSEPSQRLNSTSRRARQRLPDGEHSGGLLSLPRIRSIPMELVQANENELSRFGVTQGDLLFARQSLVREGAGKCSIVMEANEPTVFESHLIRVRLNPTIALPLYLFYFFSSPEGFRRIRSIVTQVAAAGIRGSELGRLCVPVPPLPEQRRIASVLSAYDDLIENNTRRIGVLEELARVLYRETFVHVRGLVDPASDQAAWKLTTLGECTTFLSGGTPSKARDNLWQDELPWVSFGRAR